MGIFSLFGKKPPNQEKPSPDKTSAKKSKSRSGSEKPVASLQDDEAFSQTIIDQKHKARATERKIDAIEFEMTRDIGRSKSPQMSTASIMNTSHEPSPNPLAREPVPLEFQSTLAMEVANTDYLLNHTDVAAVTLTASESVPLLEEAAILFASDQREVAEHMLRGAIEEDKLGGALQIAWFMLFDLYQIGNKQTQFDELSLEYASAFEMSPPVWKDLSNRREQQVESVDVAATPSIVFPSKLDTGIIKSIEKLNSLGAKSRSIKLDFTRVKEVDPIGCGLLLRALKGLKKTGHDLTLLGAQEFANKIRGMLEVGRRDETEAPWLLLLEILQLLQLEKAFEEASIDYCVTFEVSPPSFEAPSNKVTTALAEVNIEEDLISDKFLMPAVIEGSTEHLISRIHSHAEIHKTVILDCSELERVEFGASAQLLSGLVPLAAKKDTTIQFQDVNYLVLSLFNAMGLKNVAEIYPRKH